LRFFIFFAIISFLGDSLLLKTQLFITQYDIKSKGAMEEDELRVLVEKAKALDREAFGRIYDIFYNRIYKYIYYRVGNVTDAEDLAAQTFTGALKTIVNFNWRGPSFASWLFRIAGNRVVDHYRRSGRSVMEPLEKAGKISSGDDTSVKVLNRLDFETAQVAIGKLPPVQQQVLVLKFINDFTNKEIAATIGKSESAVKSLQFRAIRGLRVLLGGEQDED